YRAEGAQTAPDRRCGAVSAGHRDGDDPSVAVRLLGLCLSGFGRTGGGVGGLAVSQGRLDEPETWGGDNGHADLGRHHRSVGLVDYRLVLWHRRATRRGTSLRIHHFPLRRAGTYLSCSRCRGDHLHPAGPLLRETLQAPSWRRVAYPDGTRRYSGD